MAGKLICTKLRAFNHIKENNNNQKKEEMITRI
jgi:hypothetical protein